MITQSPAIADLPAQWHLLQDLDRADAVWTIHESGVSLRGLARALNCSESLLRHLLHARSASPEDLVLARKGEITTWEAARRSKARRSCQASMQPKDEATESELSELAAKGCATILRWLSELELLDPYRIQIAKEALSLLVKAEEAGKLPSETVPYGFTTARVIQQCRPVDPQPQNAAAISWFGRWLAFWAFYVIPNAIARQQALDLAISRPADNLATSGRSWTIPNGVSSTSASSGSDRTGGHSSGQAAYSLKPSSW